MYTMPLVLIMNFHMGRERERERKRERVGWRGGREYLSLFFSFLKFFAFLWTIIAWCTLSQWHVMLKWFADLRWLFTIRTKLNSLHWNQRKPEGRWRGINWEGRERERKRGGGGRDLYYFSTLNITRVCPESPLLLMCAVISKNSIVATCNNSQSGCQCPEASFWRFLLHRPISFSLYTI